MTSFDINLNEVPASGTTTVLPDLTDLVSARTDSKYRSNYPCQGGHVLEFCDAVDVETGPLWLEIEKMLPVKVDNIVVNPHGLLRVFFRMQNGFGWHRCRRITGFLVLGLAIGLAIGYCLVGIVRHWQK